MKTTVIILALAAVLMLAGCIKTTGDAGSTDQPNGTVQQNPDLPPPLPQDDQGGGTADPDMPPPLPD